jgi:hypothetical protein
VKPSTLSLASLLAVILTVCLARASEMTNEVPPFDPPSNPTIGTGVVVWILSILSAVLAVLWPFFRKGPPAT